MNLLLLSLAAAAYVAGGIAMKWSHGYRHLLPSLGVFVAFCLGAGLQTLAMRYESLGVGYVVVLGLEAILAVLAGVCLFGEDMGWRNVLGVMLVVGGILVLRTG